MTEDTHHFSIDVTRQSTHRKRPFLWRRPVLRLDYIFFREKYTHRHIHMHTHTHSRCSAPSVWTRGKQNRRSINSYKQCSPLQAHRNLFRIVSRLKRIYFHSALFQPSRFDRTALEVFLVILIAESETFVCRMGRWEYVLSIVAPSPSSPPPPFCRHFPSTHTQARVRACLASECGRCFLRRREVCSMFRVWRMDWIILFLLVIIIEWSQMTTSRKT